MSLRSHLVNSIIAAFSLLLMALQPFNQGVPGFAEITDPQANHTLRGIVTIEGTADHPTFSSYQLTFSYDPNPTETWFPLTDRIRTPVQQDGLALWDTSTITPGNYQLRLRVYPEQGQPVEAIVSGLSIGTETVVAEESNSDEQPATAAVEEPGMEANQAEPLETAEISRAVTPAATLWRILSFGAASAALILFAFGAYTALRPRVRDYLGLLRMRRIYRQRSRSQRRDRTDQ